MVQQGSRLAAKVTEAGHQHRIDVGAFAVTRGIARLRPIHATMSQRQRGQTDVEKKRCFHAVSEQRARIPQWDIR